MILQIWSFAKNYLGIVLALTLAGAGFGAYYTAQEINPFEYRLIANAWPHLHEQRTADQIREAMSDGKIIRWENAVLWRMTIDDAGMLTSEGATDDVLAERKNLQDTISSQWGRK